MNTLTSLCKISFPSISINGNTIPPDVQLGATQHNFPRYSSPFSSSANPIGFIWNISFEFIHFSLSLILPPLPLPLPPLSLSLTNAVASHYQSSLHLPYIPYKLGLTLGQSILQIQVRLYDSLSKNSSVIQILCSQHKI